MWNNIYFKSCKHWPLFFLSSDLLSPLPSQDASWELIMACCPWCSGTLVLACHEEIFLHAVWRLYLVFLNCT